MADRFRSVVLTPEALDAQREAYGEATYERVDPGERDRLGPGEAAFVAARDSFYMASVTSEGWPYIQHRGGPPGFLRVLDPHTLAFADLKGNRQLVTTGNVSRDDRVALFLMDYPARRRLKLLGRARVTPARERPDLVDATSPAPELRRRIERVFVIDVIGFDWNCPAYITPRFTLDEVERLAAPLHARIAELEAALSRAAPSAS